MQVIIAEKPDQGAKLASAFTYTKRSGYLEIAANNLFTKGAIVTWAIGHLCELVPPEVYHASWKKWSFDTLPMIPEKFQHQVSKSKWKQFKIVRDLVQREDVTEIIMAGDAGREGEAITRILLEQCKVKKPLRRLWISSLTKNAVRAGFEKLLDEPGTRNLYYEALSRSYADWLVGMNATRAYTLLLKEHNIQSVFSIGRVQTPTLALIVAREAEIDAFVPEPFWEVVATFKIEEKTYTGKWHKDGDSRLSREEMANKIASFCQGKPGEVTEVEKEEKEFQPPFFFQLSSLQATANKMYTFSPQKTLDIAQKLYVKGIISYPRTDSAFVTKEEAIQFPDILSKIATMSTYESFFPLSKQSLISNRRYVNPKKVTDHYAIIPTEHVVDVEKLAGDEAKIYDLIIRRFLAAHEENAIFSYTNIHTLVDGRATFLSKGKQMLQLGWRKIVFTGKKEEEELLPEIQVGAQGLVEDTDILSSMTKPPKRYSEGNLVTLMKTAGKFIEDEELTKVLNRTEGLGTEATRASIIGVLKEREYIIVRKNLVYATDKGKLLIKAVGDNILASPTMTAKWEQRLHQIGEGTADAAHFLGQVKKLTYKIVSNAKIASNNWSFSEFDTSSFQEKKSFSSKSMGQKIGTCPKCKGDIVDKGKVYGCSNYRKNNCSFLLPKRVLGKNISKGNAQKLLEGKETNIIKGFQKDDKNFDAKLRLGDNGVQFVKNE